MRLRALATNLAVAAASMALGLGILELAARWSLSHRRPVRDSVLAEYSEFDPVLGWRKRSGARARYRRLEYTTDVAINHQGLRDLPRRYRASPGAFRVLLVGDSHVEGYSVDFEQTTGQVLEQRQARQGCPVEVINGGTSGYSTDQELLFYEREGRRYRPDVVVLFFYYNDIPFNDRDNYWGRPKPRFFPAGTGMQALNVPLSPPAPRPRDGSPKYVTVRYDGSAMAYWLRERVRNGAPDWYQRLAGWGLWPPVEASEPNWQLDVYRQHQTAEVRGAWWTTSRLLAMFSRGVTDDGARFLVVYVPSRMEVVDRDWDLSRLTYGFADRDWDRYAVRDHLLHVAERRGFPVLDLVAPLRAADGFLGQTYYVKDGHWTPRGHATAAEALESALRERGWLPECAGQQ